MLSKGLLVIFIIGTYARTVPRFALNQDRSLDGSPSVSILFADGHADTLILSRYYSNEADRLAREEKCHFIGHLKEEPNACVGLTGCPGSEDVEITIMSEHSPETMFKWSKTGLVEIIENPFKNGKARSESMARNEVNDEWHLEGDDEEVNNHIAAAEAAIEEDCADGSCDSIPATNLLSIKWGYDDGFLGATGSHADAKAYIQATMVHVQTYYCHDASLGTKIQLENQGIKHYAGKSLTASGGSLTEMYGPTAVDLGTADLMVYMGYDTDYWGVVGIAWGGVVCVPGLNTYRSSITEWRETNAEAAIIVAHEMGHNLGMDHDFNADHAAAGCNDDESGIMSYGQAPYQWSACSKADLQAHYIYTESVWCMSPAPNACEPGAETGTTIPDASTTTGAPLGPCVSPVDYYIGEGHCDPENNNAECYYDGGDCCPPHGQNWDFYCKATDSCVCHEFTEPEATTTLAPTEPPTTLNPCTSPLSHYIGDSFCDPENNSAECLWDGGDCCPPHAHGSWKYYCEPTNACDCLQPDQP